MHDSRSQREVVVFDNRGVGASVAPGGPYTMAELVEDARAVAEEALGAGGEGAAGGECTRIDVLGISLGGMVAQALALAHPNLVNALVLGCSTHGGKEAAPPSPGFMQTCSEWAATEGDPNACGGSVEAFVHHMLPPFAVEGTEGERFLGQFKEAFLRTKRSGVGLRGQLAAMGRFNTTGQLGSIACPTLIVHGDKDAVMPPSNSESLAARIPGALLEPWQGAGHFFWATRPLELSQVVSRFLQSADGARPAL